MLKIFLFFYAVTAIATERPICNSSAVTNNCEFFRSRRNQATINLANGAAISNPFYIAPPPTTSTTMLNPTPVQATMPQPGADTFTLNQAAFLDLLDNSRIPTINQIRLFQSLSMQAYLPNSPLQVPWPLTNASAPYQTKTRDEVIAALHQQLGPARSRHLDRVLQQMQQLPTTFGQSRGYSNGGVGYGVYASGDSTSGINSNVLNSTSSPDRTARKAHIQELFTYARTQVINTILRGRDENQISADERMLIARVRALILDDPDSPQTTGATTCANNAINAENDTIKGIIHLCPANIFLADGDILRTLGHEIGHSIDPCRSQMPAFQVNQQKLSEFLSTRNMSSGDRRMLGTFQGINTYYFDINLIFDNPSLSRDLLAAGVFTQTQEGIPFERYPFRNEYSCLVNRGHFRETNSQNGRENLNNYVSAFLQSTNTPQEQRYFQASRRRAEQAFNQYRQCFDAQNGNSQMNEVMGDVFGSVVLEKYQHDNPPNEEERVAAIRFAYQSCGPTSSDQTTVSPTLLFNSYMLTMMRDEHPLNGARISRIILNLPGTAELYRCQRPGPNCFDNLSLVSGRGRSSSGTTTPTNSGSTQ